jgi:hypothetical protein
MDELGVKRVTPRIELTGFDRVNAQLTEIEARLDRIGAKSSTARVNIRSSGADRAMAGGIFSDMTGGGGGGGSTPTVGRTFSTPGGIGGAVPWWLAPAVGLGPQLLGGAGALVGSAGSAVLGAGTVGIGAMGALGAGGALTGLVAKPAIQNITQMTAAMDAQQQVVLRYGAQSRQAQAGQAKINALIANQPLLAPVARQGQQLVNTYAGAIRPAQSAFYGGVSNLAYTATRAVPQVAPMARTAVTATMGAANQYLSFLTDPGHHATPGMPSPLSQVGTLTQSFSAELPTVEKSLQNITRIFLNLSVAAQPFFHEANVWVQQWTAGMAVSTGNTAKVQSTMGGLVTSAKDWARLTGDTAGLLKDIFAPAVTPGNSLVTQLDESIKTWDQWIRNNPDKVRQFFRDSEQGISRIATVIGNLVKDIWQIVQSVTPLLSRAEQFMQFASGLGGGSLLSGAALLYGGYEGARGALGGGGPSAAGLAGTFITGGPGFLRGGGARAGGGMVVGASAAEQRALAGGSSYLMPGASSAGANGLMLAAGGGMLLRSSTADRLGIGAARGEVAFNQAYGGVEGARYAMPVSSGVVPMAERGGIVGRLGQAGSAARGAAGGAARILLPLAAIQGILAGVQSGGGVAHSINTGVSTAASTLTLGAVSPQTFSGILHAAFGTDNAGANISSPQMRAIAAQAGAVRTPGQLHALQGRIEVPGSILEMSPADQAKVNAFMQHALSVGAANAGGYASNTWETAFTRGISRGVGPNKAVNTMLKGMGSQITQLGPAGAKSFASDMATWAGQMSAEDPKMRRPLERLMAGITKDINNLHDNVLGNFKDLTDRVFYFNGQILTGSQTTWGKIKDSMVNPALVAQEKLSGIWGTIQREAIDALTQMGFSRSQARQIVTQTAQGGQAAANAGASVMTLQATGKAVSPLSTKAPAGLPKHERGGMITGTGLLDTVPVPGGMAAPGEAYIANRHTMNDLTSATMAKFGKTAWQMIRDEGRPHSAPPRYSLGGAMSGGGASVTAAHPELHAGIAAAVQQVLNRFPLSITSTTRGGHADGSYHYLGEAADIAGDSATMLRAASWIGSSGLARSLTEGIHNPNLSVKFGKGVPSSYWGAATWAQHLNHIHMAVAGNSLGAVGAGPGGAGGVVPSSISLRAPGVGMGGVPGAMAHQAGVMYAAGMSSRLNALTGSSAISSAGFHGGGSNQANQTLGRRMMLSAGWGMDQWPALQALWTQESGWNANALNSSSGAYGIPQALGHGHPYNMGDAPAQIAWGLNYIRGRYGSPAAAEAHERANNWYSTGGRVNWAGWNAKGGTFTTMGPTLFGAGEKGRETVTIGHGGAGGRSIQITMNGVTFYGGDKNQLEAVANDVAGKILDAIDRTSGATDASLAGAEG